MKLIKILAILALFLVPLIAAADLRVTLESYDPKPVIPGNFFTVTLNVENVGDSDIDDLIQLDLDVDDPLYIEGDNEATIRSLEEGEDKTIVYTIGVESDAKSGFKTITLDWDTGSDDGSESFSIQVKAIETTLVVQSVQSNPSEIAPGEEATVTVKLKNDANILLRNIKVKINLDSPELPFAPIGSVTERNIDTLNAGSTKDLQFRIITLTNAASQVYKVPLEINYFDEFGEAGNVTDLIALVVGSKPTLSVTLENARLIERSIGTLSLEIINSGLTDAKFLTLRLPSSPHYEILGSNSVYVGDVDSDDIEAVDFELTTGAQGYLEIPVQLTYRDANNKLYTESFNIQTKIYSVEEAKQTGLIKVNYTPYFITAIAIIVVLYFSLRRFFRRRKKL